MFNQAKEKAFRKLSSTGLEEADIALEEGQLVLSIVADDIYTKNATQRYTITLDADDRACLEQAAKD